VSALLTEDGAERLELPKVKKEHTARPVPRTFLRSGPCMLILEIGKRSCLTQARWVIKRRARAPTENRQPTPRTGRNRVTKRSGQTVTGGSRFWFFKKTTDVG
jgi:hypothetical protein